MKIRQQKVCEPKDTESKGYGEVNFSNLWNNTKQSNIYVTGIPEREGKVCVCVCTCMPVGEGVAEYFQDRMKTINPSTHRCKKFNKPQSGST